MRRLSLRKSPVLSQVSDQRGTEEEDSGNYNGKRTKSIYAHWFCHFVIIHLLNLYPDLIIALWEVKNLMNI